MIQIHLDDNTERLLNVIMEHDKEKTATSMVRSLIRDGLRERGLWPLTQPTHIEHGVISLEETVQ